MQTRKITKQEQKKLSAYVSGLLTWIDATDLNDYPYQNAINTKAGRVIVSINILKSLYPTMFCRFDDVETARNFVDATAPSGKYNLHATVFETDTVETLTQRFYEHLRPVLTTSQRVEAMGYLENLGITI